MKREGDRSEPDQDADRERGDAQREALEKLRALRRSGILTQEQFEDEERRLRAGRRRR